METQTRFDLTTAIENWRQELAAQPDLTPDVRWELETHLRDTVAELQRRGLNGEESFWLARRRAGQPKLLGEEFAKADPTKVWRERLFYIAIVLFAMQLWFRVVGFAWIRYAPPPGPKNFSDHLYDMLPSWISFYLPQWLTEIRGYALREVLLNLLQDMPILCLALWLLKRRLDRTPWGVKFFFESRIHFMVYTILLLMGIESLSVPSLARMVELTGLSTTLTLQLSHLVWPLSLIAIIAWLMPVKKSPTLKSA